MPQNTLCILVCASLQAEIDALTASAAGGAVVYATFPSRCGRPPLDWNDIRNATAGLSYGHIRVIGGCCVSGLGAGDHDRNCTTTSMDNCFRLLISKYAVDTYVSEGAYLVTPGWLMRWREHIDQMGFNMAGAQVFFAESCRKVVLVDTGVSREAVSQLAEFAAFVARPYQVVPAGLDLLTSFVERSLHEWRRKEKAKRLSEYATAIDLLGSITRLVDEEEVIQTMFTFYATLFGASRVAYTVMADGKPVRLIRRGMSEESDDTLLAEAVALIEDHRVLQDDGFLVSIRHGGCTIGVVRASGISLPRYRDQYLNLALATAGVWGLVLNNARSFQRIAEMTARLQAQQHILEGINKIFAVALSSSSDQELGRTCVAVAEQITGSGYGFILEIGADGTIRGAAASDNGVESFCGNKRNERLAMRNSRMRGLYGKVLQEGTSLVVNDLHRHPDSSATPPGHPEILSFLGVPLKEEERISGMIAVANSPVGYSASEQEALEALAPAVVAAYRRRRAELALQQANELLEERVAERTRELADRETRRIEAERSLHQETLERLRVSESLREKERLLIQQSRLAALGEMINNIAHQWRQPLNQVGLIVQELQMDHEFGVLDDDSVDQKVRKTMDILRHMSQTVDDFRNFFKPDKKMVRFRVREVVTRTLSLVEESFKAAAIPVSIDPIADPEALGYPNEYAQVLLNILLNGREVLLQRGEEHPRLITISISAVDGRSLVTIADTGGGIAAEILPKIFDPYFTTKGPEQGTGLGLYMSKMIIEKNMNGRLEVRNTGDGAEFSIQV